MKIIFEKIVQAQEFVLYLYYQNKTKMENPTKFKSVKKVQIQHERGTDFVQIEGNVQKIEKGRVYLKGLFYDFSISLKDFQTRNVCQK